MAGFIFQPQTLFAIGPSRQFGGNTNSPNTTNPATGNGGQPIFKNYVTVTEDTIDALEITQQPVQQGANVADHAFKKPTILSIKIIFGPSFTQSLSTIYKNLLALQSSFQPFNCTTPKRTYYNMLLAAIGLTTDKAGENILSVNCTFQNIITVPIGITTVSRSQLANPGSNGGTASAGTKTVQSFISGVYDATTGLISSGGN